MDKSSVSAAASFSEVLIRLARAFVFKASKRKEATSFFYFSKTAVCRMYSRRSQLNFE